MDAQGWADLFNGLGGKQANPVKPTQFIPYPKEFESKDKQDEDQIVNRINRDTALVIRRLIKDNLLDPSTVSLLSPIMDEVVSLSG